MTLSLFFFQTNLLLLLCKIQLTLTLQSSTSLCNFDRALVALIDILFINCPILNQNSGFNREWMWLYLSADRNNNNSKLLESTVTLHITSLIGARQSSWTGLYLYTYLIIGCLPQQRPKFILICKELEPSWYELVEADTSIDIWEIKSIYFHVAM